MKKSTINWLKVPVTYLTYEEMNAKLDEVYNSDLKQLEYFNYVDEFRTYNTYSKSAKTHSLELRISYGFNRYRYIFSAHNAIVDNNISASGMDAYMYINDKFMEKYDISIYSALSGKVYKDNYLAIKKCVPTQINYINIYFSDIIVNNANKADVSSAFPTQLCKKCPTLKDCIKMNGRIEPNEDYPFAFYINSHHIKIYNELDTREFNCKYYEYYNNIYNDNISDDEEITILCKASTYSFKDIVTDMYNKRKDIPNMKFFMNASIGFMQRNDLPILSHISAVVIARCNKDMLDRCKQLDNERNLVLYIATDSIIWKGKLSNIATDDKYLGSFTYEGKYGRFYGKSKKAYQYEDENGNCTTKYSGMKNGEEKDNIPFGELEVYKYSNMVIIDNKTGYITEVIG